MTRVDVGMTPLMIGYFLILLLFLGLPRRRANPALRTDAASTRRTGSVLGVVHLVALFLPLVAMWADVGPRATIGVAWMGVASMCAGLFLQRWAQRSLGSSFTLALQSAEDQAICSHGPYRLIRHPAYLAQIAMWIGLALTSRNIVAAWIIAGLTAGAYAYRLTEEERVLIINMGERYRAYMSRTKRLLPFVW